MHCRMFILAFTHQMPVTLPPTPRCDNQTVSRHCQIALLKNHYSSLFCTTENSVQNSSSFWFGSEKCGIDLFTSSGSGQVGQQQECLLARSVLHICTASGLGFYHLGQDGILRVASSAPCIQSLAPQDRTHSRQSRPAPMEGCQI